MIKKIKTIEFYDREYDGPKIRLFLAASIGGLSFALMLAVVNQAAEMAADVSVAVELYLFLIYLLICSTTIFCKNYTLKHTTTISNKTILKVRIRLVDKIRHSELQFLESTKKGEIYARIIQDTELIAQASPNLVAAFEAVLAGIAVFVYISILSFSGFIISLTAVIAMYVIFYRGSLAIKEKIRLSRVQEADFLGGINDVLSGFKEIKVNSRKNNDLFSDIQALSKKSEKLKTEAEISHDMNTVTGIMLYQLVLGTIVFIAPLFIDGQHEVITKLVASVLFFFGISSMATRGLFSITRANVAVENLEKIDAKLSSYGACSALRPLTPVEGFKDIALRSISFQYPAKTKESSFSVGPVDLHISQGEVIFIVGGNGSGKSTLMKILTGLYYPASGGIIELDGQPVALTNYQSYRELFSVIFTDFHLFKKLYGLEKVGHKQVNNLLEEMGIHTKTDFADGRFTKIDLSTGQRKRLAYIVAMLEDKSILVFDEWAADQDSTFRKLFYEKFLDDLRAMNKTVVAVTHDDRYFGKADRIIKLDDGKIVEEKVNSNG